MAKGLVIIKYFMQLYLYHTIPTFNTSVKKPFENIVGKGENAGNQHFLLFPQCFLPFLLQNSFFKSHLILLSANAFNLDQSKILLFGKELYPFFNFEFSMKEHLQLMISTHKLCFRFCFWVFQTIHEQSP